MGSREERIEDYCEDSKADLAEWLVDAEDEIDMWAGREGGREERG